MRWYVLNSMALVCISFLSWVVAKETLILGLLLAGGAGFCAGGMVYLWRFRGLLNEMETLHKEIMGISRGERS